MYQETFGQKVQKKKYRISGHFVQRWGSQGMTALLLSEKKEQKEMESMRDVNRVMEREIKKGSTPLQFEQLNFGDYSYNEISSQEKLVQVLSYLLRIGEYKSFAGKTIGNNVYMDIKWKKVVFKRTRLAYERNDIFATIKRLAKKYKLDFAGKVYLETVRCYFTISEEELKKCRYNYKGKDTYAFVLILQHFSSTIISTHFCASSDRKEISTPCEKPNFLLSTISRSPSDSLASQI